MSHADRILMGPGPGNPYPEVMEAFARPVLGHLDPDFLSLLDETNERLRTVWQTNNLLFSPWLTSERQSSHFLQGEGGGNLFVDNCLWTRFFGGQEYRNWFVYGAFRA